MCLGRGRRGTGRVRGGMFEVNVADVKILAARECGE